MLFGIYINQKAFIDLKLKISFEAAAALYVFQQKMAVAEFQKHAIQYDGKLFFWFNHSVLIDNLPLIFANYGTENAIRIKIFRLTNELVELGLIEKYPNSQKIGKSYYAVTNLASQIIETYFKNETEPISKMKQTYFKNETEPISKMKQTYFKNETEPISKMKQTYFKNETHSIISIEENQKNKIRENGNDTLTSKTQKKVNEFLRSKNENEAVENDTASENYNTYDIHVIVETETDEQTELANILRGVLTDEKQLITLKQKCRNLRLMFIDENIEAYIEKFVNNYYKDGDALRLNYKQTKSRFFNSLDWLIPNVNQSIQKSCNDNANRNINSNVTRNKGWQPRHDSTRIREFVDTIQQNIEYTGDSTNVTDFETELKTIWASQEQSSEH